MNGRNLGWFTGLLLWVGLLRGPAAFAADPLVLNDGQSRPISIGEGLAILEDPDHVITYGAIRRGAYEAAFDRAATRTSLSYTPRIKSAYWVRLRLVNRAASPVPWVLEQGDFHTFRLELYYEDSEGNRLVRRTGFSRPFGAREMVHKNFAFMLPLRPGHRATVYLKIDPVNHPAAFAFRLFRMDAFLAYANTEYLLLGLFYGFIFIIALYNLFLYLGVGDPVYGHFLLYILSAALLTSRFDGLGFQYLWPHLPDLNYWLNAYAHLPFLVFGVRYARSYLELPGRLPALDRVIRASVLLYLLYYAAERYGLNRANLPYTYLNTDTHFHLYLLPWVLTLYGAWRTRRHGYPYTNLFGVSLAGVVAGVLLWNLCLYNVLHFNAFMVYFLNYAIIFQIAAFAYALSCKTRGLKREREKAQAAVIRQLQENEALKNRVNRELEQKVWERTVELHLANEEITRMNRMLDADNKKLQSDLSTVTRARVMQQNVNLEEFHKIYPDENSCYAYLSHIKWKNGYACKKCSNPSYGPGQAPYSRRCTSCGYVESATARTVFHKLKFPIDKAFYIVFLVSADPGITAEKLAELVSLREKTCWLFRKKILEAMGTNRKKNDLKEEEGWGYLLLKE